MNHFYQKIEGWMDFEEVYNRAIKQAVDGDILVETGTWFGKSACYLGVEALNSGKSLQIYTIDIDKTKVNQVEKNIFDLSNVIFINKDSLKTLGRFKDKSLAMVFLDASHEYEFVSKEIRAWYPKVKPGGIFAGHDYDASWPGVVTAVQEFAAENNLKLEIIKSSWLFQL